MIQITAPHFCAGLVIIDDRVVEAAPIIRYMRGWTTQQVREYVRKKRWSMTDVPTSDQMP